MKYRTDFVTNSSSSSSVVLRLNTTLGSKEIEYEFGEPGYWSIQPFRVVNQKSLMERLSGISDEQIQEIENTGIFCLPKDQDYDGTVNYQLVYNHMVLTMLRKLFHIAYNNPGYELIDGVIRISYTGQILIDNDLLNERLNQKGSTESLSMLKIIKVIVDFNQKINTFDDFNNNTALRKIFDLSNSELIIGFSESITNDNYEEQYFEKTVVDLKKRTIKKTYKD